MKHLTYWVSFGNSVMYATVQARSKAAGYKVLQNKYPNAIVFKYMGGL